MLQNPPAAEVQVRARITNDSARHSSFSLKLITQERRVVGTLLGITAFLVLAGLLGLMAGLYLPDFFGRDMWTGLFDLDGESNIPATFSALILLLAALILGVIAWARRQAGAADALSWVVLALIFGFLALDEATMLHERIGTANITRSIIKNDGILYYAWVVPYGILTVVVGLSFLRFLLRLPPQIRNRVVLAGLIYVGGALGLELLESLVAGSDVPRAILKGLLVVAQEGMEMLGITLFIGALLSYIRLEMPWLNLRLSVAPAPATPDTGN